MDLLQYFTYAIRLMRQLWEQLPDLFVWLPGEVIAFIIPAMSICVLYRILGWGD